MSSLQGAAQQPPATGFNDDYAAPRPVPGLIDAQNEHSRGGGAELSAPLPWCVPRTVRPPFAFPVEPVSFANGAVRLAGGFLKPEGGGPFPVVVLVHGAGPGTFAEPAFRVHANAFVRAGFAALALRSLTRASL